MSVLESDMSPKEYTRDDVASLAEAEAQSMLGVSTEEAFRMLDAGALAGTIAEAEMRMLRFLLEASGGVKTPLAATLS
jgi:hypothetical protein